MARVGRGIKRRTLPKELLVVGPAGSGKTFGILAAIHKLCRDYARVRVLMARATRAALTESVLATFEDDILPLDGMEEIASGASREHRRSYQYPSGSRIVLGGLDKPNRILSTAWDIVYINECIEATEEVWETILSRMNRPGRSSKLGYLIGDTNPGDPQHWLKRRIDSGLLTEWVTPHEANPAMHDWTDWTPAGRLYLEGLDRLTGTRRKRLRHGLWAAGEEAWFQGFDPDRHVSPIAEYDSSYPVHLACDNNGLHTGAVWFQVREGDDGPRITVFGDYYNDSGTMDASSKAGEILARSHQLCNGHPDHGTHDPAAGARLGFNTTIAAEYERAGLRLHPWPVFAGSVLSGLNLIESFLASMAIHPRCQNLVSAMVNYRRAKRNGQWIDQPADPQHPHEDLIDSLRGGLLAKFPEGRRPPPKMQRAKPSRVF